MRLSDPEYAAIHEAGHYVAALALGLDPAGCAISPDGEIGMTVVDPLAGSSLDQVKVALAGLMATRLAGDFSPVAWDERDSDVDKAMRFMDGLHIDDLETVGRELMELIKSRWALVMLVAGMLLADGEVLRGDLAPAEADGYGILARTELPKSVYHDVVLGDEPEIYWRLDESKNSALDSGLTALNAGTLGPTGDGTYLGPPELGGEALVVNDPGSSMGVVSDDSAPGTGDMGVSIDAADFSLIPTTTTPWVVELWCIPAQDPGVNGTLFSQRAAGGSVDIHVYYTASNTFVVNVFSNGTDQSVNTSPTTFPTHARYHIVVQVVPGETVKMWVNGTLFDDAETFTDYDEAPGLLSVGTLGSSGGFNWDGPISHFAAWRGDAAEAVDQTWVDRHYAAGTSPWQDDQPDERLGRILDLVGWPAELREIDSGNVALQSASFS